MQVLDFIPFPLPNYQFTIPFHWAAEHAAYVIQGGLMFQFTLTHAITEFGRQDPYLLVRSTQHPHLPYL
jgi:hypothetical protein